MRSNGTQWLYAGAIALEIIRLHSWLGTGTANAGDDAPMVLSVHDRRVRAGEASGSAGQAAVRTSLHGKYEYGEPRIEGAEVGPPVDAQGVHGR